MVNGRTSNSFNIRNYGIIIIITCTITILMMMMMIIIINTIITIITVGNELVEQYEAVATFTLMLCRLVLLGRNDLDAVPLSSVRKVTSL